MNEDVIFSGFGGQGALFAGQLLAYACLDAGLEVTWIPSYGPQMRGGTTNCTVVISDQPIGSPLTRRPSSLVALNLPSLEKYTPLVKAGGHVIYNASLMSAPANRQDVHIVPVPANAIAEELGNVRQANVVLLGAYLAATSILPLAAVEVALEVHLPAHQHKYLASNKTAMRWGADCTANSRT